MHSLGNWNYFLIANANFTLKKGMTNLETHGKYLGQWSFNTSIFGPFGILFWQKRCARFLESDFCSGGALKKQYVFFGFMSRLLLYFYRGFSGNLRVIRKLKRFGCQYKAQNHPTMSPWPPTQSCTHIVFWVFCLMTANFRFQALKLKSSGHMLDGFKNRGPHKAALRLNMCLLAFTGTRPVYGPSIGLKKWQQFGWISRSFGRSQRAIRDFYCFPVQQLLWWKTVPLIEFGVDWVGVSMLRLLGWIQHVARAVKPWVEVISCERVLQLLFQTVALRWLKWEEIGSGMYRHGGPQQAGSQPMYASSVQPRQRGKHPICIIASIPIVSGLGRSTPWMSSYHVVSKIDTCVARKWQHYNIDHTKKVF